MTALLGADARVGPRRVDEGDDRQLQLLRELHLLERLAVALWMSAAEVAGEAVLYGLTLTVADEQEAGFAHGGEAGHDRGQADADEEGDQKEAEERALVAFQLLPGAAAAARGQGAVVGICGQERGGGGGRGHSVALMRGLSRK